MGDVDWSNVPQPVVEAPPPKEHPIGVIIFVVLLLLGVPAGLGYLNYVMLGDRVRQIALSEGIEPMLIVKNQGDCYAQHVTIAMPASLDAFQTPATSPQLGIASVALDEYRACVSLER